MNWLARFLLWSTAALLPFQAAAGAYERLLLAMVSALLGGPVHSPDSATPDLSAANMLGVYVAMCLATIEAPRQARVRALGIGLIVMVCVECARGVLSIEADLFQSTHGVWPAWGRQLVDAAIALPRFTSAPAVWLWLLGSFAVPAAWQLRMRSAHLSLGSSTRSRIMAAPHRNTKSVH